MNTTPDIKEHKIVRGILFRGDELLMAKALEEGHYFLPGGKIETGEKAKDALQREFVEETGWQVAVADFYGCLENRWHHALKNTDYCEINFFFGVTVETGDLDNPASRLPHIAFEWVNMADLDSYNIQPPVMKDVLRRIHNAGGDAEPLWESFP